uniref:WAP domain-containing protein n=1 Tax=Chrysemys picta bellii TaxID=8478 RepID=A0A8C3IVP4_CHRPI
APASSHGPLANAPLGDISSSHQPAGLTAPLSPEKAGVCPAVQLEQPEGLCLDACVDDADCPGDEKCCATGCGSKLRPGVCPAVAQRFLVSCRRMCRSDSDCPAARKCCSNGCGQLCMAPVAANFPRPRSLHPCSPPRRSLSLTLTHSLLFTRLGQGLGCRRE